MKLESTTARYMSEKDMWQKNLESIEESWTCKVVNHLRSIAFPVYVFCAYVFMVTWIF